MSETDWYLLDRGGRRYGPYDRGIVEGLAAQRQLRALTPVWHPGLARWQPASRVLKLPAEQDSATVGHASVGLSSVGQSSVGLSSAASPMAAPGRGVPRAASRPPAKAPAKARAPAARPTPVMRTPSPARVAIPAKTAATLARSPITPPQIVQRVLAAVFDLLCLFVAWRILRVAVPNLGASLPPRIAPLLFIGWALIDAAFITRLGATPGKALFAVRIRGAQDEKLDYPRALARSAALPALLLLLSLKSGLLTVFGVLGLLFAAARMRGGSSPWWDDVAGVRVTYGEITPARRTLAGLAFIVAIVTALALAGGIHR